MKIEEPHILTLGDMLPEARSNVQVVNECNETLIICVDVRQNVRPLSDLLNQELLDRPVKEFWIDGNFFVIKVAGVEDAE